jgi:hypothetical protein
MPQICQFLGVNSVTNIELPKGFMPALICIFANWLGNPRRGYVRRELSRRTRPQQGLRPDMLSQSGLLPLGLRLVAICRFTRARRRKVKQSGEGLTQNRVEFDAAAHDQRQQ